MRTPEEFAEDAGIGVDNCGDLSREDLAEVIRERDAEVRAATLAEFTEERRMIQGWRMDGRDDRRLRRYVTPWKPVES